MKYVKEQTLSISQLYNIATGQKLKPPWLKTLKKTVENFLKTLKSDDNPTFTQRHSQVKMNEKKLLEYKCTKQILKE